MGEGHGAVVRVLLLQQRVPVEPGEALDGEDPDAAANVLRNWIGDAA